MAAEVNPDRVKKVRRIAAIAKALSPVAFIRRVQQPTVAAITPPVKESESE